MRTIRPIVPNCIVEVHSELAGLRLEVLEAVNEPQRVLAGGADELFAVREINVGKYLVAVYKELQQDGFVITAFVTRRLAWLDRRKQVWP